MLNTLWHGIKYALFVHIDVHAWEKSEGKRERVGREAGGFHIDILKDCVISVML